MTGIKEYRILSLNINGFDANNQITIDQKDLHKFEIKLRESELIRMLLKLDNSINTTMDYPFIGSLIQINIGRHIKSYYQEIDKEVYAFDNFKLIIDDKPIKFKRLISGSGNVRNSKVLYIRADLFDKVNTIILCGLPTDLKFKKLCKFNAYYGLTATDSRPVTIPKIVVIPDYNKTISQKMDVVTTNSKEFFDIDNNIYHNQEVNCFDGAGLVSVQMASKWAKDLGLDYIPGSFQIRVAGAIKGNLFTFDIKSFASEIAKTFQIVDYKGTRWNVDNVDCILTESQFKFLKYYNSFNDWKTAFNQKLYGYQYTFNISDYALSSRKIKNNVRTTYQILQSLSDLSDNEVKKLCDPTIKQIEKISTDVDEFLRFRGLDQEDSEYIPDYYKALKANKTLFYDKYIQTKIKQDLKLIKRKAESGKLLIDGNYQISCPDIFGLAQWAFGKEPTGLLQASQVYCDYWNRKNVKKIAIWRNPHVSMEWCLDNIVSNTNMRKWYKYQQNSIITSLYSLEALRLGGSDFDGDELGSTNNSIILAAVKRNMTNTVATQEQRIIKHKDVSIPINNTLELIQVDAIGMSNNIGSVVNKTSILWSLKRNQIIKNPDGKDITVADAIKIMSVIDSLTIDFVKSGKKPELPEYLKSFLKQYPKPIFMAFAQKIKNIGQIKAILRNLLQGEITQEEAQRRLEALKLNLNNCTMNKICLYMFNALYDIEIQNDTQQEFDFRKLMSNPERNYDDPKYRELRNRLIELQNEFNTISEKIYHKTSTEDEQTKANNNRIQYQIFYSYAKNELLLICPDMEKLIDWLLIIYYTDKQFAVKRKDKSILWNCFGSQLIRRSKGKYVKKIYKSEDLVKRAKKLRIAENKNREDSRKISVKIFKGLKCLIYGAEIKAIHKRYIDDLNCQRLAFVILVIFRMLENQGFKIESNKKGCITPSQICKLCGINWYQFDKCFERLKQDGTITVDKYNRYKVNIAEIREGKQIEIADINTIQHLGKELFRYERSEKAEKNAKS